MKEILVKDLMVPLDQYATINEAATLYEAVLVLEKAQAEYRKCQKTYLHRAVLVYDATGKIVGKLSQIDLLKGLEPKYNHAAAETGRTEPKRFSRKFLRSLIHQFSLWDRPLVDICKKAAQLRVKDCMDILEENEFVEADDSLAVAVHHLVLGRRQSLLVMKNEEIVGILRLTDVFHEVTNTIKACQI